MKPVHTIGRLLIAGLAIVCMGHASAQAEANSRKGVISTPPTVPPPAPQVQTPAPYGNTKPVTGVIKPPPPPAPQVQVAPAPSPLATPPKYKKSRKSKKSNPGHGGCPPGLAKKNNGCLPPGQAK